MPISSIIPLKIKPTEGPLKISNKVKFTYCYGCPNNFSMDYIVTLTLQQIPSKI